VNAEPTYHMPAATLRVHEITIFRPGWCCAHRFQNLAWLGTFSTGLKGPATYRTGLIERLCQCAHGRGTPLLERFAQPDRLSERPTRRNSASKRTVAVRDGLNSNSAARSRRMATRIWCTSSAPSAAPVGSSGDGRARRSQHGAMPRRHSYPVNATASALCI
jgi:hypothetical protein